MEFPHDWDEIEVLDDILAIDLSHLSIAKRQRKIVKVMHNVDAWQRDPIKVNPPRPSVVAAPQVKSLARTSSQICGTVPTHEGFKGYGSESEERTILAVALLRIVGERSNTATGYIHRIRPDVSASSTLPRGHVSPFGSVT